MNKHQQNYQDVAAVITAMTDGEAPFLFEAIKAVLADSNIGQVIVCIDTSNTWLDSAIGPLKTDPRLEIVRMPLAIPGVVRNRALAYVKLPWIAYCDGDDVWCAGKTALQRSWAEATKSDFVGVDHCLINEESQICAFALARSLPMLSSWLVRTEVMRQYPFSESSTQDNIGEDWEWWLRTGNFIRKTRYPKILLKYRIRQNSVSSNLPARRQKERAVGLARLPVLRAGILLVTAWAWFVLRQENYIWLKAWGPNPAEESRSVQRGPMQESC